MMEFSEDLRLAIGLTVVIVLAAEFWIWKMKKDLELAGFPRVDEVWRVHIALLLIGSFLIVLAMDISNLTATVILATAGCGLVFFAYCPLGYMIMDRATDSDVTRRIEKARAR